MRLLTPAADASEADWLVAGLRGFAESVLSVVPAGFPAYARLFHPAYRVEDGKLVRVRWAEVAAMHGARAHAGMQMDRISGRRQFLNERAPAYFDQWPEVGSVPSGVGKALAAVLAAHTSTPSRCWFAVWNGWADTSKDELMLRSPTVQAPNREYLLLTGPVEALVEGMTASSLGYHSANLWWPDDRAWCVATEIDLNSTYVGCSAACREALLQTPDLEALPIDPETGVDFQSDLVNSSSPAG